MKRVMVLALVAGLSAPVAGLYAADQEKAEEATKQESQEQQQERTMIFGWQLMSVEERAQHRAKMRSFKTQEEREAYRKEHHERMQARAREQGLTLPQMPRQGAGGGGRGSGANPGAGRNQ